MENQIDVQRLFQIIAIKEYELSILREKIHELEKKQKEGKKLDNKEIEKE